MIIKTRHLWTPQTDKDQVQGRKLCLATCKDTPLENMTSKNIYKELLNIKTGSDVYVPRISKHTENSGNIEWKGVYAWANIIPVDTKTKEFQFRFVHDLLANGYWLKKWKVQESARCLYCERDEEDILHMFWSCNSIRPFWTRFEQFCTTYVQHINIVKNTVLLGDENSTICLLIFIAKQYIYHSKVHNKGIEFKGFIACLKKIRDIEFQSAKENKCTDQCQEKWSFLQY